MYAHEYPALFDGLGANAGNSGVQLATQSHGWVYPDSSNGLWAVNNQGQATGSTYYNWQYQAMLTSDGAVRSLGTLGGTSSEGTAINNLGQVSGISLLPDGSAHAFLYSSGTMQDLGTLSGGRDSLSFGMNDKGQVVGYSEIGSGSQSQGAYFFWPQLYGGQWFNPPMTAHAVIFDNGKVTDLGTLGGTNSSAMAINNAGTVVGVSETTSGVTHAFEYQAGKMIDLGMLPPNTQPGYKLSPEYSTARAINDAGQIVGSSNWHAFLYQNGKMLDLNQVVSIPHVTLTDAIGINSLGQIMAIGVSDPGYENLKGEGEYLLTPLSLGQAEYGVPEPSMLALFAMCAGIMLVRSRSRRRAPSPVRPE
jgi:probable HAF family extracellular repeat protein